jgi:hypothetical protein
VSHHTVVVCRPVKAQGRPATQATFSNGMVRRRIRPQARGDAWHRHGAPSWWASVSGWRPDRGCSSLALRADGGAPNLAYVVGGGADGEALSGLAEVVDWSEAGAVGRVEVNLEVGQERLGRVEEAVAVIPPAMTGQLLLHIAPEPLDQIELGRIGGQKERLQTAGVAPPDLAQRMTLVIAHVVEDEHGWCVGGQRLCQVLEEGAEGGLSLARAHLPEHLARRIVDGAKHRELLVLTCRRNPHCLPLAPPDLCQVRVGVDFAFVHVDQMESLSSGSFGLSSCFFGSQPSTCLAVAIAS